MSSATSTIVLVTDPTAIAQFNRGPLTTLATPPTSCTATLTLWATDQNTLYFGHYGYTYVDLACFPTGTMKAPDLVAGPSIWGSYYYSPAICPEGYSTATTWRGSSPCADAATWLQLGEDTTAALCCPTGYSYFTAGHQCTSTITQNQVVGYVFATNKGAQGWDRGSVSSSTFAQGSAAIGDGVPIWWQSSDLALLADASTALPTGSLSMATGTAARTSPTASVPTSTSTTTANEPGGSQSSRLSTGTKAGIGVGVPLAVILALALGFLLFR